MVVGGKGVQARRLPPIPLVSVGANHKHDHIPATTYLMVIQDHIESRIQLVLWTWEGGDDIFGKLLELLGRVEHTALPAWNVPRAGKDTDMGEAGNSVVGSCVDAHMRRELCPKQHPRFRPSIDTRSA